MKPEGTRTRSVSARSAGKHNIPNPKKVSLAATELHAYLFAQSSYLSLSLSLPLTLSRSLSLAHSLTDSLTHPPSHSLTHSLHTAVSRCVSVRDDRSTVPK